MPGKSKVSSKASAKKTRRAEVCASEPRPRRKASAPTYLELGRVGWDYRRNASELAMHPEEVARWWYDFMAPVHKYRWKVGSIEKARASAEEARAVILSVLASRDGTN